MAKNALEFEAFFPESVRNGSSLFMFSRTPYPV